MDRSRPPALALALALALAACGPAAPDPGPPGLADAEKALAEGRYGAALRGLRALNLGDLAGAETRLRAARAAAKVREWDLAARILEPDAKPSPGKPAAGLLRAEALVRSGKSEAARAALTAMAQAGVRPERWRYVDAILLLVSGEKEAGERELDELEAAGTRDADVLVRWAQVPLALNPRASRGRLTKALERVDDRAVVEAARGALILMGDEDPQLAIVDLEDAIRARPFDRDARLALVYARVRTERDGFLAQGVREARALVEEDPDDGEARMALAEALGEQGHLAALADGGFRPPPGACRSYEEAAVQYREMLKRGVRDSATAVRALQGLARTQVELIPMDPIGPDARGPASHFAAAMDALEKAEAEDPRGTVLGPWGVSLLAETCYLRGRACKRVHAGDSDNRDALGWYEKAIKIDPRHLEANWDLGLLCKDFFRNPEYMQIAARAFGAHIFERRRRGLPDLDPERARIAEEAIRLARENRGEAGGAPPPKAEEPPGKQDGPR